MYKLDEIDLKLLDELQINSKQSIKELAKKVNLSISPTHERIKKMENSGVIKKYVALIDPKKLNKSLQVYLHVILVRHHEVDFIEFEDYLESLEEVIEVSYITGEYDFLLKIQLSGMEDYQNFIIKKISQLEYIAKIQSSFVLKQSKPR